MTKIYTAINAALGLAMFGVTVFGLLALPNNSELAVHWTADGRADIFLPKEAALVLPLVLALGLNLLFWFGKRTSAPGRHSMRLPNSPIVLPTMTGVMLAIQIVIVFVGLT